ncbi:MAG TPA: hypothetical protein ENJ19_10495 [Gammaproteobacteria bacterium]|nr:hypothetical protein [Gammaproteobacteria bacterium]
MNRHLVVALSGHGYGHLAQVAPVLEALRARLPALRLTLLGALPRSVVAARLPLPFAYHPRSLDVGMVMEDALTVDVAASCHAYARFHARWQQGMAQDAALLERLAPDYLLCDVPYRILAAAAQVGVPAAALCSLNWADIYAHFCGQQDTAAAILAEIEAAYGQAEVFYQPAPSMPMPRLPHRQAIGPLARSGRSRRAELAQGLRLRPQERLGLVSLGGIPTRLDLSRWPSQPGWRWIVPAAWHVERPDLVALESLALPFPDVLRSADVLLTKPGYGSFAEAACNGVPVLYVPRKDWPEERWLVSWLKRVGRCAPLSLAALRQGRVVAAGNALVADGPPPALAPSGVAALAARLAARLSGGASNG